MVPSLIHQESSDKALGVYRVKHDKRQRAKDDDREPGGQGGRNKLIVAEVLAEENRHEEDSA